MKITKKNDALVFEHLFEGGWSQRYLFISDLHFDSKKCDRDLLKKLLDEAKETNAKILIFGDIFDAMGGKFDPRTTKADIRPEYNTGTYYTDIVKDAAKFLRPYADYIALIADGNHETSYRLRHEGCLLDNLRYMLDPTETKIHRGKYNGFIKFKNEHVLGGIRSSKVLYYSHGGGGNSPVTKGVIKTNRRQEAIQADYFVSAHIHTEFEMPRTQARLNLANIVVVEKVIHWQLGCFKNDFLTGGWADHKEFAPPNLGGRWVEFKYINKNIEVKSWMAN